MSLHRNLFRDAKRNALRQAPRRKDSNKSRIQRSAGSSGRGRVRLPSLECLEDRRLLAAFNLVDTLLFAAPQAATKEGFSVATGTAYHVTGKPFADVAQFADSGVVEVYDATTNSHVATINNPTPASSDWFGYSVAVSGERVVVGAYRDDTLILNAGQRTCSLPPTILHKPMTSRHRRPKTARRSAVHSTPTTSTATTTPVP